MEEDVSGYSENNFRSKNPVLFNDVKCPLAFSYWTFSEQLCTGSAPLNLCNHQLIRWQTRTLNAHSECTQLNVAKGLRSSCLHSCRNCNVHKMECLESVWTNCSSFLDGFKEGRTLRETIPAISPAGWKKTHSVKEISFKTKLILRTQFQSKNFHCFQIFFNEPHMVLGVYWESS